LPFVTTNVNRAGSSIVFRTKVIASDKVPIGKGSHRQYDRVTISSSRAVCGIIDGGQNSLRRQRQIVDLDVQRSQRIVDGFFYGYTSQMPPSESTTIQSLMNAGVILHMMRDHIGDDAVRDVWIDETFGGILAHAIVAITPAGPGHGKPVGRTIADIAPFKLFKLQNDQTFLLR
jgi:hypothetical protein